MSEKIRLKDGKAYRGDKLVAWYDGDELKFKHWKFKALKEEIEELKLAVNSPLITADDDPEPQYPQELISMGKHVILFRYLFLSCQCCSSETVNFSSGISA